MAYERSVDSVIKERINEPRRFIQIVIGPRQTGKTTAVAQALAGFARYAPLQHHVAGNGIVSQAE